MGKKAAPGESTLAPWLKGTKVHERQVRAIPAAPKSRSTRTVVSAGARENVPVPELQDHLLLQKGYLPKYSGLPLEHFAKSSGKSLKRLQAQDKLWNGGNNK